MIEVREEDCASTYEEKCVCVCVCVCVFACLTGLSYIYINITGWRTWVRALGHQLSYSQCYIQWC